MTNGPFLGGSAGFCGWCPQKHLGLRLSFADVWGSSKSTFSVLRERAVWVGLNVTQIGVLEGQPRHLSTLSNAIKLYWFAGNPQPMV